VGQRAWGKGRGAWGMVNFVMPEMNLQEMNFEKQTHIYTIN
jgi:hypothetical protein